MFKGESPENYEQKCLVCLGFGHFRLYGRGTN